MRPPRKPQHGLRGCQFVDNAICVRWNRTLMRQRGEAMGAEFRGKGVHVALAPMM